MQGFSEAICLGFSSLGTERTVSNSVFPKGDLQLEEIIRVTQLPWEGKRCLVCSVLHLLSIHLPHLMSLRLLHAGQDKYKAS